VGTDLTALGELLGDGENVLRGLNPAHCDGGVPTEGCFILKRNDALNNGPSFGILEPAPEEAETAPIGARQGICVNTFAGLLPSTDYGIARLNVGVALEPIRGRESGFIQNDEARWGPFSRAHAMFTGYQSFGNQERKDLQRHLARIAAKAVLKAPAPLSKS